MVVLLCCAAAARRCYSSSSLFSSNTTTKIGAIVLGPNRRRRTTATSTSLCPHDVEDNSSSSTRSRQPKRLFSSNSTSRTGSISHIPAAAITGMTLHVETIIPASNNKDAPDTGTTSCGDEIVFLHGLLGHGRNLKTFAKQVCEIQQKKCIGHLMDLRGHGQSRLVVKEPSSSPSSPSSISESRRSPSHHSFAACVEDIAHTVSARNLSPTTWVGHSWGGRMALQYVYEQVVTKKNSSSSNKNINKIDRLWLLDVVPGQANESVERVVGVVAKLQSSSDESIGSKKELVERLTVREGFDMATAQWLASSYNPTKLGGDFGFDLQVVQDILPEFGTQDFDGMLVALLEHGVRVDLVRGGKNTAWQVPILNRLESLSKQDFPQLFGLHVLPKAGHWVHVDDLKGLVSLFASSSPSSSAGRYR